MANIENKDHKREVKKRFVKALYSYVPVNNDELTLKVNDILEVIEETEEGWWKGILDGNVGMFPSNFVIELDGHPEEFNNKLMNELSPTKNLIKAKNVVQQEPMHRHGSSLLLADKENVKQPVMNAVNSNEIDGTASSKSSSSEQHIDKKVLSSKKPADSSAPKLPPKPVREQARALFPYFAQNEDELTLKEGDIITVISKEVEDKGWWRGELNNKVGVFPDNFVKVIKAEEQKKPERPDKPSTVISSKISSRTAAHEKNTSEVSPKTEKKVIKTPPAKPPPPDLHKKDLERPLPPCPSKKPQPPHPVKKPIRVSVGGKIPGFSAPQSATVSSTAVKSPISETSPPISTYPPSSSEKVVEESKKVLENSTKEKDIKKVEPEFDVVESSGKKLVHLTANRVKAPNRRPPSYIFLKENDKDSAVTATDSRRRSEPLLAEMESLFPSVNKDTIKNFILTETDNSNEKKPKVPPPRPPFFPTSTRTSTSIKSSIFMTKGSSSFEEVTIKSLELDKKDLKSDAIPAHAMPVLKNEVPVQKTVEVASNTESLKEIKVEKEESNVKNNVVTWKEFSTLLKEVKELKELLEAHKSHSNKAINDLKIELEEEKRLRRTFERDLQSLKGSQTT